MGKGRCSGFVGAPTTPTRRLVFCPTHSRPRLAELAIDRTLGGSPAAMSPEKVVIAKGKTDQTTWDGAGVKKNLFPRKYYWKGVIQNNGSCTWGEACDEVRHFDCVGLLNYCFAKHYYKADFGLGISAYRDDNNGVTTGITDNKDLMDADILVKPGDSHIGMLCNNGGWFVVQAVGTAIGLTDTESFNPSAWIRRRMKSEWLVGTHS